MKVIRIQTGHYGRKQGATGAVNPRLGITEADMNHKLALVLGQMVKGDRRLDWQFIGPDERRGGHVDLFVALHMDGSANPSARGPSVGYPVDSVESKRFARTWKQARSQIPGALPFRDDNYTAALRKYYAYRPDYSGHAPVKMVLENGFVTNDQEATWAAANRTEVAAALVGVIHDYFDVVEPDPPVDDLVALKRKVDRLSAQNARQARFINGLQTRVTRLEGEHPDLT